MNLAPGQTAHEHLKQLLRDADYDGALALIEAWDFRTVLQRTPAGVLRLQLCCMTSDVWDYGGQYPRAAQVIREEGKNAYDRIASIKSVKDLGDDHAYVKQSCWAVMMWGMCFYRGLDNKAPDHETAKKLFQLARQVLEYIAVAGADRCSGSLARAWYCLGLVERQEQEYRAARAAFRHSIEFAGRGIEEHPKGSGPRSFDYHIARCNGLGIGWISYNAARLNDAASALVIARRLIGSKRAKFISAYIDVVRAAIMLSESMEPTIITEAISILKSALAIFLPEKGFRQQSYALRAQNELAGAYLRLANIGPPETREANLRDAERYIASVKDIASKLPPENRTFWMARILEARVARARGDYEQALSITKEARERNSGMKFTLIDACIGFGEAAMGLSPPNYRAAIDAFSEALRIGGSSRKIAAVCRLHLCRAYLADNQVSNAREQFALWEPLAPNIENAFIAHLGKKTRERLNVTFPPFTLSKDDLLKRPSSTAQLNALRKWLAETAVAHTGDLNEAGNLLQIHPDSVKTWLKF